LGCNLENLLAIVFNFGYKYCVNIIEC
jgi:hypothetical protein